MKKDSLSLTSCSTSLLGYCFFLPPHSRGIEALPPGFKSVLLKKKRTKGGVRACSATPLPFYLKNDNVLKSH